VSTVGVLDSQQSRCAANYALNQCCLRRTLSIQMHDFVRDAAVCHTTELYLYSRRLIVLASGSYRTVDPLGISDHNVISCWCFPLSIEPRIVINRKLRGWKKSTRTVFVLHCQSYVQPSTVQPQLKTTSNFTTVCCRS